MLNNRVARTIFQFITTIVRTENMVKMIHYINPKTLYNISIKDCFSVQLLAVEKLSFGEVTIRRSKNKNQIVETFSKPNPGKWFHCIKIAHIVLNVVKGFLILKDLHSKVHLSSFVFLQFLFWCYPNVFGVCIVSFCKLKSTSFANFVNTIFTLKIVTSKSYIRFILFISTILPLPFAIFYFFMIAFTNIDPAAYFLFSNLKDKMVLYLLVRLLLGIYEIWSFTLITLVTGLVASSGMFCGYVAVGRISKELYNASKNRTLENFKNTLKEYRLLQIYSILGNDSFKDIIAIPIQVLHIITAILCSTALISAKIRRTTSIPEVYFFVVVVLSTYSYVYIAY